MRRYLRNIRRTPCSLYRRSETNTRLFTMPNRCFFDTLRISSMSSNFRPRSNPRLLWKTSLLMTMQCRAPEGRTFWKIFEERLGQPDVGVKKDQHVAFGLSTAEVPLAGHGRRPDYEVNVGEPFHHQNGSVFRSSVDDNDFVRIFRLFGYVG